MDKGLESLLVELNRRVETKRRQLESLTKAYAILLKPWPHVNKIVEEDENKDSKDKKTKGVECEGGGISAEEKHEVDHINKLLAQATKARNVQKRVENKGNRKTPILAVHQDHDIQDQYIHENIEDKDKHVTEKTIREELRNLVLQEKKLLAENLPKENASRSAKRPDILHGKRQNDSHGTISQGKDDSHSKEESSAQRVSHNKSAAFSGRSYSHGRASNENLNSSNTRSLSASNPRSASNSRGAIISKGAGNSERASSSSMTSDRAASRESRTTKRNDSVAPKLGTNLSVRGNPRPPRPSASRGKTYSAHLSAPFKTDPHLRVPRMTTNLTAMAARRRQPTGRAASTGRNSRPVSCDKQREDGLEAEKSSRNETRKNSSDSDYVSEQSPTSPNNTTDTKDSDDVLIEESSRNRPESSGNKPVKNGNENLKEPDDDGSKCDVETKPEILFTLQTEGGKLPVSSKFRRKVLANQKLREQLLSKKVTKKVEKDDAKRDFLEKLESQCCPDEDLLAQTHLLSCLSGHNKLLQLLSSLKLHSITELSDLEEILAAKMKMEYILASVNTLQEEIDLINRVSINTALNKRSPALKPPDEAKNLFQWMPRQLLGDVQMYEGDTYAYHNKTDLQAYRHHIFQLQYQQLQAVILDSASKEFIPLLQSTDPKSRSFVQIYRAAFAFLTSEDGHHLPGIVKDS